MFWPRWTPVSTILSELVTWLILEEDNLLFIYIYIYIDDKHIIEINKLIGFISQVTKKNIIFVMHFLYSNIKKKKKKN